MAPVLPASSAVRVKYCPTLLIFHLTFKTFFDNIAFVTNYRKVKNMSASVVSLNEKFSKINVQNEYRIIAQMNDYQFKLVRMNREFIWHAHPDTDETFFVVEGELEIELRDKTLRLIKDDLVVIPKGIEHKPKSIGECRLILIEPTGTLNTGNAGGDLTDTREEWI
jgi:mannose-6-phosphate isomerase-like protein (cupin superfamily)